MGKIVNRWVGAAAVLLALPFCTLSSAAFAQAIAIPLDMQSERRGDRLLALGAAFDVNILFRPNPLFDEEVEPFVGEADLETALATVLPKDAFTIVRRSRRTWIVTVNPNPTPQTSSTQAQVETTRPKIVRDHDEIIVTGLRQSIARSIDHKRHHLGISDAVFADEISQLPEQNAAEALKRLPGAGSQIDQGEARYTNVRGVDALFHAYSLNGIPLPSPDQEGRQVPLDLFEAAILDGVVIEKSASPETDSYAAGSQIRLYTPTPETAPSAVGLGLTTGWFDQGEGTPIRGFLDLAGRVTPTSPWAGRLTVTYSNRPYLTERLSPDYWQSTNVGFVPEETKLYEYDLERERWGGNASVSWRPDGGRALDIFATYLKLTEKELRYSNELEFSDVEALTQDSNGEISGDAGFTVQSRNEVKEKNLALVGVSYQHEAEDWSSLVRLGISHASLDEPTDYWKFTSVEEAVVRLDLSNPLYRFSTSSVAFSPENLELNRYRVKEEEGSENRFYLFVKSGREWLHDTTTYALTVGSALETIRKRHESDTYNYLPVDDAFLLSDYDLTRMGGRGFIRGRYNFSTVVDLNKAAQLARSAEGLSLYGLDTESSFLASATDIHIDQTSLSGFLELSADTEHVTAVAGVRVEALETDVLQLGVDARDGFETSYVETQVTDVIALPRIQLLWRIGEDMQLRFGAGQSLAAIDYTLLGAPQLIRADDDGVVSVRTGNPYLTPSRVDAFDAEWVWMPSQDTLLSLAASYRGFEHFPSSVMTEDERTGDSFTQPQKGAAFDLYSAELRFDHSIDASAAGVDTLGISAGVGYTELVDKGVMAQTRSGASLFSIPQWTLTQEVYAQMGDVEARVSYQYTDDMVDFVGDDVDPTLYIDGYGRLDAKVTWYATETLSLYAEGINLNDEPLVEYANKPQYIQGYEVYGPSLFVGANLRF